MRRTPTISVVMATYNGARFLREQLDSICNQTYPIEELILQDDGSNDETLVIAREFAAENPQMCIIRNEKNLGFNRNFITALKKASGEYVAIADQDDIWFPEKLEKQVRAIERYDLCHSELYIGPTPEDRGQEWLSSPQNHFISLLFTPTIYGHTMLVKREVIHRIKDWGESYITYDWRLSLEACLGGGIKCVHEPLNWHRHHESSAIAVHRKNFMLHSEKATWQPYVIGIFDYYRIKKKSGWKWLYAFMKEQTDGSFPLEHRLCSLLLKDDPVSVVLLCCLCMKSREKVNHRFAGGHGWGYCKNRLRGFFFPFIRSYTNTSFDFTWK